MPSKEVLEFAEQLITLVRDRAVSDGLNTASPTFARSPPAKRWRKAGINAAMAKVIVPDVVDDTLFRLLDALDNGLLKLKFVTKEGQEVDLESAGMGELAGWYTGSQGWREMFSEQPFFDDCADLLPRPH
jgi:hypothetical protein